MKYIAYLINKYKTFFVTLYHVVKALYKADSEIAGFTVSVVTNKDLEEMDAAVSEREKHLDVLRTQQKMMDNMSSLLDKRDLN